MAILQEYHAPESISDALRLLQKRDRRLVPLAGGTTLIGALETRTVTGVDGVVDLRNLGLTGIYIDGDRLRLGAMTTLAAVAGHRVAGALADGILRRAAQGEGPVNRRNAATIGGIVAGAETDSEFYAALLALNAAVITDDGADQRTTPLDSFSHADGLIVAIIVPITATAGGLARVARTPSDRPIVAALCVHHHDGERIGLCGIGTRPLLYGERLDPPDDHRGSAAYRRAMADLMVARARRAADAA